MPNLNEEDYMEFIFQKIYEGKVVLFLGAGASVTSGGPVSSELVKRLHIKFEKVNKEIADLNELCEAIEFTEIYGRKEVYNYLQEIFINLKPSESHKILSKYDWLAIFTTNYDTIIEQAFREEGRLKPPKVIRSSDDNFNPFNRDVCHIVKLNGCASRNFDERGNMAITTMDIEKAKKEREKHYELLFQAIKDGTLIFIGYSFRDLLALNVMRDVVEQIGERNVPFSFALFPNLSKMEDWEINRLKAMKIIPIEENFQGFCSKLKEKVRPETIHRRKKVKLVLEINGNKITIDENNALVYQEYFHILNNYDIVEPTYDKEGFFRCTNKSWGAYKQHWDFERDYYSSDNNVKLFENSSSLHSFSNLKERIFNIMNEKSPIYNKIFFIPGIPGIGKTVLARRLAYDIYKGGYPVIFCDNPRNLTQAVVVKLFKEINTELNKLEKKKNLKPTTKLLLIVDNAASAFPFLLNLKNTLIDQNIPILIVALDRLGEWSNKKKKLQNRMNLSEIYELKPVDKFVEQEEKNRFINHLMQLELIKKPEEFVWNDETTFFGLMYSLVHPSQETFHTIIRQQYQNLSDRAQELFNYIAIVHHFNCAINLELLARVLETNWREVQDIIEDECKDIVNIEEDRHGNITYRTHHRIIATKTIEFFIPDLQEQTDLLINIFRNSLKKIDYERDLCHTIAVDYLSQRKDEVKFTKKQIDSIFEAACEKDATSTLLHHSALIKYDLKQLEEATSRIKESLKKAEIEKYEGYNEKINYIFNTWGMITADKGFREQEQGNYWQSEMYFRDATRMFYQAKKINPSDSYPYFTEAYILMRRGNRAKKTEDKVEFYAKALELVDIALDYADETKYDFYYKTKITILTELETISTDKVYSIIVEMAEKEENLFGYYLLSYKLYEKLKETEDEIRKNELYKEVIELLDEALKYNPNDSSCLNLKIKIIKDFTPNKLQDIDFYYTLLNRLFTNQDYINPKQLYDYGLICFKKGYYDKSKEIFSKLKRSSIEIARRYMIRDQLKENFEGEVVEVNQYRGWVISVKPHISYKIYFNPLYQEHIFRKGDNVRFEIAFNYLGPIAINMRHI